MKLKNILMTAALSLIMSGAYAGQIVPSIQIRALPFTIIVPGTYVLVADLICPPNNTAVTINTVHNATVGKIVLDLKGHAITGSGIGICYSSPNNPVIIKNGTIQNMSGSGICAIDLIANGSIDYLTIQNMVFKNISGTGILLQGVNDADVSGCSFIGPMMTGIMDVNSLGGNQYSNLVFDGKQTVNISLNSAMTINRLNVQ